MIKVNLVGKKRIAAKGRNWFIYSAIGLFIAFCIYFLYSTLFVVIKLTQLKNQLTSVEAQTETVSKEMTANDQLLKGYVLSKFILGRIDTLNKQKFPYLLYLDQLVGLMPQDVTMRNVDFTNAGWVAVSTSIPGVASLGALERNLTNANLLSQTAFSSIFTESVSKEISGFYIAKLQFEINKNGSGK